MSVWLRTLAKWVALAIAAMMSLRTLAFGFPEGAQAGTWARWVAAIENHTPGKSDLASSEVAEWTQSDLEMVLGAIVSRSSTEQTRLVRLGLILHTDVAILQRETGDVVATARTPTLQLQDGEAVGGTRGTFQWEFARRLLQRAPRGEERSRVAKAFYRATSALLQAWGDNPELERHLASARRVLGADPVLLMFEGTLFQAYAGPRFQRYFADEARQLERRLGDARMRRPFGLAGPAGPEIRRPSAGDSRERAESLFREALALDPGLQEARVRLAYVLSDMERHQEAGEELVRAGERSLPPLLQYYAAWLEGREASLHDPDRAERAYRRAASLSGRGFAPYYGLSELALRRGDRPGALLFLKHGAQLSADPDGEPLAWFSHVHVPPAAEMLDDMRKALAP